MHTMEDQFSDVNVLNVTGEVGFIVVGVNLCACRVIMIVAGHCQDGERVSKSRRGGEQFGLLMKSGIVHYNGIHFMFFCYGGLD